MPDEHGGVVKENYLWKVYNSSKMPTLLCMCVCGGGIVHVLMLGMLIPLQVLLHRSTGEEGKFLSVKSSEFDQDLFLLSWGPTVAALSYVFDKADEKSIVQRAIDGFRYARQRNGTCTSLCTLAYIIIDIHTVYPYNYNNLHVSGGGLCGEGI